MCCWGEQPTCFVLICLLVPKHHTAYSDYMGQGGCHLLIQNSSGSSPLWVSQAQPLRRAWCARETGLPAACTFLKSQLHASYSSPGMKPTSHVASPLPRHTLAYLSHAVSSASHCCQKHIPGLLITFQWAWGEGRRKNAHPGTKRHSPFTQELEKPAGATQMGQFAGEEGTL